ncbi:hypothetical protein IQ235_15635 [Oscillatoriales cyanobacterium LEGE 11467]|uniref:Uncharacterized protein n=1 Tax=Zarconia navalis LEGE 11467 TaxID=1828826 RepID=A0A928W2W7_9CYAN|nr:hypothetical protein [Zarconia navalis]MBE9042210.1 hypothetical protein [Zarconia navalis LEGE 11467]
MSFAYVRRTLAALLLSAVLLVTGCSTTTAPPASSSSSAPSETVSTQVLPGSEFNKFFPSASGEFDRVYTQEKEGFAEAKLKQNGNDVAMLAISDTASTPAAVQKYQQSRKSIAGYPAVEVGSTQTAILVAERFQVKAISRDSSFTGTDREAWLQKFDLNGLARLQ